MKTSGVIPALSFLASASDAGTRLDVFLAQRLPDVSRSQLQRLIRDGQVRLSRGTAKPALAVWPGLSVEITLLAPESAGPAPEPLPLTVLHDDADIVVIDKPGGMVVHPAAGHARGTLVNALLHHVSGLSGIGGRERPGLVHRLDRGTSGVMIIAKHDRAHRLLAAQFHDRQVEKEYVALVWGKPRARQTIARPIGRDPRHRLKMSTRSRRPREAVTDILDIEPLGGVSLIRVGISTGRTHQIRVHLSEAGHAVVGDALYGGVRRKLPARLAALKQLDRPFLHAARLAIKHPADSRRVVFEAPLASDLAAVLAAIRVQN